MEILDNFINGMKNLLKCITNSFFKVAKIYLVTTVVLALINHSFAATPIKEKSYYELQAELLYNFINHVNWPSYPTEKELNLCIMEDNPVLPHINILLKNNANKDIKVIRKHENDYLEDCSILFINDSYDGYLSRLLSRIRSKPILTIGNIKGFAEKGGIIQFNLRNNRVEFTINMKELKSSHLKIDNAIISVSEIIN